MSLNLKQNVKCPKCSQMSEVTVWNSITVKDSEDLKHDLLTGKVNMFRCPSCSYSALMPTPMLYHDEDKLSLIHILFRLNVGLKPAVLITAFFHMTLLLK